MFAHMCMCAPYFQPADTGTVLYFEVGSCWFFLHRCCYAICHPFGTFTLELSFISPPPLLVQGLWVRLKEYQFHVFEMIDLDAL